MTCNPADLYHLPGGSVEEGTPADLVILIQMKHGLWILSCLNPPIHHLKVWNYMEKFITLSGEEKLSIRTDAD